jgi:hypothetical protein
MTSTPILNTLNWANAATPPQLAEWIHARLHGMDTRWPTPDDGFDPPHCLISEISRHSDVTLETCVAVQRATRDFIRKALPAWAKATELFSGDHTEAEWSGPALIELLALGADLFSSEGPHRAEIHALLQQCVTQLPKYTGEFPLRAKGLLCLLDFGGHSNLEFWKSQFSSEYPEATSAVFAGMVRQDVEAAARWLGESATVESQAQMVRMYRPTLVRRSGSIDNFKKLVRHHLFRSNHPNAKKFAHELAPIEDRMITLRQEDLSLLSYYNREILNPTMLEGIAANGAVSVVIWEQDIFNRALRAVAQSRYEMEFTPTERASMKPELRTDILRNLGRSLTPNAGPVFA